MKVYLIEPQGLFVPILREIFESLHLGPIRYSAEANFRSLVEDPPDIIFVDVDFSQQEPLRFIALLRTLVPKALIAVYTGIGSSEFAKAYHFSGANAVLTKSAEREEILEGLQQMIETGTFTDVRVRSVAGD